MLNKKFLKNILIYGFSTVLGRVIFYLLVPFHTLILSPEQYGILTEFYIAIAILQIVYTFGIETAYFRFHKEHPEYKSIAQTTILIISLLISLPILLCSQAVTQIINISYRNQTIFTAIFIVIIDSFSVVPLAHLRLLGRAKLFAVIKFLQIILNVFLNVIIVFEQLYFKFLDKESVILTILLANAISNFSLIPAMLYYTGGFKFQISLKWIKKIITYNMPIVYMSLMILGNELLSRLSIKLWLPENFYQGKSTEHILGIFSASQKLSVFITIAIQAYRHAAEPLFFNNIHNPDKSWLNSILYWFIASGCALIIIISLNLELLAKIFFQRKEYYEALSVVPIMLVSALLSGVYYNISFWFKSVDENKYGAIFASIGCAINLAVSAAIIPIFGYWGAAISSLAAYIIMIAASYFIGNKYYNIKYSMGIFSILMLLAIFIVYTVNTMWIASNLTHYMLKGFSSLILAALFLLVSKVIYNSIAAPTLEKIISKFKK